MQIQEVDPVVPHPLTSVSRSTSPFCIPLIAVCNFVLRATVSTEPTAAVLPAGPLPASFTSANTESMYFFD